MHCGRSAGNRHYGPTRVLSGGSQAPGVSSRPCQWRDRKGNTGCYVGFHGAIGCYDEARRCAILCPRTRQVINWPI